MKQNKPDDISFLGKVVLFLRSIKRKLAKIHLIDSILREKRAISGYADENSPDEAKLSYILDLTKLIAILLLCVFLIFSLIFAGRIISYENVYYMFKDIEYSNSFTESPPSALNYSKPINNQSFTSFKNGLAVAGDSEIKFFTSEGRVTLTAGSSFTNPKITSSNGHALVYDQGSRNFSIYNSFISVHSETLDQPISFADMSEEGSYCIVTKAKTHGSVLQIYDKNFRLLSSYSKNDYILSASMSENGKYVTVLSLDTADGQSFISLNVLKIGKSEIYSTAHLYDLMPYTASFISDDRILVICDEMSLIYDLKGNKISEYAFPAPLTHISISKDGFALAFSQKAINSDSIIVAFEAGGMVKFTAKIENYITDLAFRGNYAYVLSNDQLIRVGSGSSSLKKLDFKDENAKVVTFENGKVMVCTSGTAYFVSFEYLSLE